MLLLTGLGEMFGGMSGLGGILAGILLFCAIGILWMVVLVVWGTFAVARLIFSRLKRQDSATSDEATPKAVQIESGEALAREKPSALQNVSLAAFFVATCIASGMFAPIVAPILALAWQSYRSKNPARTCPQPPPSPISLLSEGEIEGSDSSNAYATLSDARRNAAAQAEDMKVAAREVLGRHG
jgi:hypothetical protein